MEYSFKNHCQSFRGNYFFVNKIEATLKSSISGNHDDKICNFGSITQQHFQEIKLTWVLTLFFRKMTLKWR